MSQTKCLWGKKHKHKHTHTYTYTHKATLNLLLQNETKYSRLSTNSSAFLTKGNLIRNQKTKKKKIKKKYQKK